MQQLFSIFVLVIALLASLPALAQGVAGSSEAAGPITGQAASGEVKGGQTDSGPGQDGAPAETPLYDWQAGPQVITLLDQGSLTLPAGYAFLDGAQSQQMLRRLGNPNVDDVAGVVTGPGNDWLLVIRVGKIGFVKDGDAGKWDVDALMAAIRQDSAQTNALRSKAGAKEIEVLGWLVAPNYDPVLHQLSTVIATRNQGDDSEAAQAINANTFALGRDGYVSLNLISGLAQLEQNRPHAASILEGFAFAEGKRYADFEPADALAPFGLSGLVSNAVTTAPQKPAAAAAATAAAGGLSKSAKLWIVLGIFLGIALLGLLAWFLLFRQEKPAPPALAAAD